MDAPLTQEEIEFMELFHDPVALFENLIPVNENAPHVWSDEEQCLVLYLYQIMMLNFCYLIEDDPELSNQKNFNKKKGAGDCFSIGSRNTGKSMTLKADGFFSWIHKFREACLASFDQKHLTKVTEPLASYLESHPIAQIFHLKHGASKGVSRKVPGLRAISEHGCLIEACNEKTDGNKPGEDFHSKHYEILWYEEADKMSKEGTEKRIDSGSSLGYIYRPSGIPDLRLGSPLTNLLKDKKNKRYIWRLPQYVRPDWSDEMREKRIQEYNGASSSAYKLNVEAEIMEGAEGFWDMARLKENCYSPSRRIKYFEVNKENYNRFKQNLIIERLPGAEQNFICTDLGYGGTASEVIILFYTNKKYKYIYNIPLFKLIPEEQIEVLYWIYEVLGGAFFGIDNTTDHGVVADGLVKKGVPSDQIVRVDFNSNIEVDFETDPKTGYILKDRNGQPIMKNAYTQHFAMQEMENLFYNGLMDIPQDEKFFEEFNGINVKMIGNRPKFGSSTHDDLHQSFQTFAICRYFNEFNKTKNQNLNQKRCWCV